MVEGPLRPPSLPLPLPLPLPVSLSPCEPEGEGEGVGDDWTVGEDGVPVPRDGDVGVSGVDRAVEDGAAGVDALVVDVVGED